MQGCRDSTIHKSKSKRAKMGRYARVGERVASALAERLARVVPPAVSVTVEDDGSLYVKAIGRPWGAMSAVRDLIDQEAGELNSNIEATVRNALYVVQDYVTEVLSAPWPSSKEAVPYAPNRLPMPRQNAVLREGRIDLWYGEQNTPVLVLPSISLSQIIDA